MSAGHIGTVAGGPTCRLSHVHAISFEAGIEDVVIARAHAPFASARIDTPFTHGLHRGHGPLERQRNPLIVADPVACKIAPTVAPENDGRLAATGHGDEQAGLRHMAEVGISVANDTLGAVGPQDVRGRDVVRMGSIPTVQVRGTEIIAPVVFEHGVAFAPCPTKDSSGRLDIEEVRWP